jgi:heme/copper-type cytochrome/quinol oxidase subunit 1
MLSLYSLNQASAGWTIYPPLSALPQAISGSGLGMTLWLVPCNIYRVFFNGIIKLCGYSN